MLLSRTERLEQIVVPHVVPFYTQHMDSKNYAADGFTHSEVAEYWSEHGDGVACLRMVIDALSDQSDMSQSQSEWIHKAVKNRVFSSETGWDHHDLVDMARQAGINGVAKRFQPLKAFIYELEKGHLCVASVTPLFKGGQVDEKGNVRKAGGHLVVVFGLELNDGVISHLMVHHPSSVPELNWENKWIWVHDFEKSFTGNYMAFWK